MAGLVALPHSSRQERQRVDRVHHQVRPGESLSTIARRYGISVRQLMADNGLRNANHVRVGQRLAVRSNAGSAHAARSTPAAGRRAVVSAPRSADYVVHKVTPGQTLSMIARRYGTSVTTIKRHNRIGNSDHVRAGERLRIPTR
jgi:LysM repeat protein